jgi:undecaprenyl diphosphate synthase
MKSTLRKAGPAHVAVVMDGNGRWAEARGKPRGHGHERGAERVREIVEAAPALGIRLLTLYVFSTDNWRRPPAEVAALFRILRGFLRREVPRAVERGIRISFLGRRDRLPGGLADLLGDAERATEHGTVLHLRLALDYSARDSIVAAARAWDADGEGGNERERFARLLVEDVDLLVRTGGEKRLSDFLLWECAYAELVFTKLAWPDFDARALARACATYRRRDRRFGDIARPRAERRSA